MRTESWKERWHEFKERVMHPWSHGEHEPHFPTEAELEEQKHKVDDVAGSEFLDRE